MTNKRPGGAVREFDTPEEQPRERIDPTWVRPRAINGRLQPWLAKLRRSQAGRGRWQPRERKRGSEQQGREADGEDTGGGS